MKTLDELKQLAEAIETKLTENALDTGIAVPFLGTVDYAFLEDLWEIQDAILESK